MITTLKKEVPIEKRIEIYKEVIKIIEKKEYSFGLREYYLCLFIPCFLFGLIHYLDEYIDSETNCCWDFEDCKIAFPEINDSLLSKLKSEFLISKKNKIRIEYLKNIIDENRQLFSSDYSN